MGCASYYSQELGTLLRVRYNTESYGQDQRGNLDIGSMQVFNYDDAITFIDGQLTLNDVQGPGFNIGVGCRWLDVVPFPWEPERMLGVSLWADGTSTEANNFFPQVGISYESLGDMWDFRANGYIPLGKQDQTGKYVSTGEIGFERNFLSELTQATVDHSLNVGEFEVARRLGAERDAWFFAGGYALVNDTVDTGGYRLGLRGYAYPDVLLQIAISDDDLFQTNAAFSLTWFVGRTRTDYHPTCGLPDRFREPVMRNDYVALTRTTATSGIPLTDTNGDTIRFVHVDSDAAAGGDGTYENPLNDLDEIHDNSQTGDIVLAWAESQFTGESAVLRTDQRFLGEGDDMTFTVTTSEQGTIDIPETSPGARSGARPIIQDSVGDAITLADNNEVANFTIDGGANGIVTGANPTTLANLHDLGLQDIVGSGIQITNVEDGTITIADVTSTGGTGFALDFLNIENVDGTSTVTVDSFAYDGGAGAAGGIRMDNFDGDFVLTNSTLTGGTQEGVSILNESSGTFDFTDTNNTFDDIAGTTFLVNGDTLGGGADNFTGIMFVFSDFTSDAGHSVEIRNIGDGAELRFDGAITDNGTGLLVDSSSGGNVTFNGDMTFDTGTDDAVTLTDNTDTTIDFAGELDITTTSGTGFLATGGGNLTASTTTNSVETTSGIAADIEGMTIGSTGVTFAEINSTAAASSAIIAKNNTGGAIVFGTLTTETVAGDNGTITTAAGNTDDTIVIENSANVAVSGLTINNGSNDIAAVAVTHDGTDAMTVDLNNLDINGGARGIAVTGGSSEDLTMTVNDVNVNSSTDVALGFTNVDNGTVAVNNVVLDGNNVNGNARGYVITNSDATFTSDSHTDDQTIIREFSGTDFEVSGGEGTITMDGDIVNSTAQHAGDTSGKSIYIHAISGGSVDMTGEVTDDNAGIHIADNTGGDITLRGTYTLGDAANERITVENNSGDMSLIVSDATIETSGGGILVSGNSDTVSASFNTTDIDTTSGTGAGVVISGNGADTTTSFFGLTIATATGDGFNASNGGNLTVTGADNTIDTGAATALTIDGMDVVTGVTFESVSANGGTNGIVLNDVTGSAITIGDNTGTAGDGGTIQNTTGVGISITDAANVVLNDVTVDTAGGDAVAIEHSTTDSMSVTLNDLNVDTTNDGLLVDGSAAKRHVQRLLHRRRDHGRRYRHRRRRTRDDGRPVAGRDEHSQPGHRHPRHDRRRCDAQRHGHRHRRHGRPDRHQQQHDHRPARRLHARHRRGHRLPGDRQHRHDGRHGQQSRHHHNWRRRRRGYRQREHDVLQLRGRRHYGNRRWQRLHRGWRYPDRHRPDKFHPHQHRCRARRPRHDDRRLGSELPERDG